MSDSSKTQATKLTAEGEPFPILMVRTTETDEQLEQETIDLAQRGITRIVFHSHEQMETWKRRLAALNAADAERELALKRQTDRNAKRRAKRREAAQAA